MTTETILNERAKTHGSFADNARIAQTLRAVFRASPGWEKLHPVMRESLDMDACKLSRILSGNCSEKDHWVDRAGYATLVVRHLEGEE